MPTTVLYAETMYPDDVEERRIFGPDVTIIRRAAATLADVPDADCAAADGLMIFRLFLTRADLQRFPKLRAVVRMGVGYDRLDRAALAEHGVTVCNIPDYGTTEVADHAIALALSLRRGILLHHDLQRGDTLRGQAPAIWWHTGHPLLRRTGVQTFGILGLGRIGTATALRAKALGFRVVFFDPMRPNGTELSLGIERVRTLHDLVRQADVLSLHVPETPDTRGLVGRAELEALPPGAVVVNTARGPVLDLDALLDGLRSNHISGAGLDVLPVEPPVEPLPALLRAYRDREDWLAGRLVVTPHSAYWTPQADWDIRTKGAETMRAALLTNQPQNVIPPDSY